MLLLVFAIEAAIMLVLPYVALGPQGSVWEGITDAALLSLALAPVLWYVIVRPLQSLHRNRGQLLARVFEAQEEERRRLGRDLHDELGQQLTAVLVGLRSLEQSTDSAPTRERAGDILRLASTSLADVRRLARGLRPDVLEDFGLATAVQRVCEDFKATHALNVDARIAIDSSKRYLPAIEIAIYRMLQEALTNVARHAQARAVKVELTEKQGGLHLRVTDDGRGFNLAVARDGSHAAHSFGLRSMRERAQLLQGQWTIRSSPGKGTMVSASLPATAPNHGEDTSSHR